MKKIIRHTLFGVFVTIFFVTAPVILFYASGYRYNFAKHRVEQTGHILITSKPSGIGVTIDGKAYEKWWRALLQLTPSATPVRAKNLLPGEYKVQLNESGYWPWERTVTVEAQHTTFLTDIALLKNAVPEKVIESAGVVAYQPIGDGRVAYATMSDVVLFDQVAVTEKKLWTTTEVIEGVLYHPGLDSYLVTTKQNYWLIRADQTPVKVSSRKDVMMAQWGEDLIVLQKKNEIITLDANGTSRSYPKPTGLQDVYIHDGEAYMLVSENGQLVLRNTVLGRDDRTQTLLQMPYTSGRFLSVSKDRFLVVQVPSTLLVLDMSAKSPRSTAIPYAHSLVWMDESSAMVWGDFEVATYRFLGDHFEQDLIVRTSEPIQGAVVLPKLAYGFISQGEGGVRAWELFAGSAQRNTYQVSESKKIDQMMIDPDEGTVWLRLTDGVYRLKLKD